MASPSAWNIGAHVVIDPGFFFRLTAMITLTGGTILLMWIGEQITSRGVGNGISLIIFAGIVARFPAADRPGLGIGPHRRDQSACCCSSSSAFGVVWSASSSSWSGRSAACSCTYPKRQVGNKIYGGESSHLPLKLNVSGVIPPIFASSILLLPTTVASFNAQNLPGWLQTIVTYVSRGQPLYLILYALLILFFAFFYTSVVFNPEETAENLEKYGGVFPGIRPGKKSAQFIDYTLTRITVIGALYLAFVCLIPEFMFYKYNLSFSLGGTSILIVVRSRWIRWRRSRAIWSRSNMKACSRSRSCGEREGESGSVRTPGGGQGHTSQNSYRETRPAAAFHRRHAARGDRRRHTARPGQQGADGQGRPCARRDR